MNSLYLILIPTILVSSIYFWLEIRRSVNNELIIKKIKIYFSVFLLLIGFLFISNGTVSDDGFFRIPNFVIDLFLTFFLLFLPLATIYAIGKNIKLYIVSIIIFSSIFFYWANQRSYLNHRSSYQEKIDRYHEELDGLGSKEKKLFSYLSDIEVSSLSHNNYEFNKNLILTKLKTFLSLKQEQLKSDSTQRKIAENLFNQRLYFLNDEYLMKNKLFLKNESISKFKKLNTIRIDTMFFSKDKSKLGIVCTFTVPDINHDTLTGNYSSDILLLVGKKYGNYYWISHENHSQGYGVFADHSNQKTAFVYGLMKYLNAFYYPTPIINRDALFSSHFWNDSIGRFNFVQKKDSLVHRFQYDTKDTSSLRYCFPTLKINLKVN